jgi:hypothetical protein
MKQLRILGRYQNGNYNVIIHADGTKVRENELDFFESSFPENIDIKISNRCDMGCPMCHENSTMSGGNADLLNLKFIDTLQPYTELAIGGGNVFENPGFVFFLRKLKEKKIIANITINQRHFEKHYFMVRNLMENGLVYGVGVSLVDPTMDFLHLAKQAGRNLVIHAIVGVITREQIQALKNQGLKILLLGYKTFGRGKTYGEQATFSLTTNHAYLYANLKNILLWFDVVSFDNLAIEQLKPERFLTKEKYAEFYMGDEGQFTMYVDAVKGEFAKNSISTTRYPLKDNIIDMFNIVKRET